jgi:hypothetical protein
VFFKENGVKFRTEPMANNLPRLSAFNGWPPDNAAPVLEVNVDKKVDPMFYTHYDLFDKNGLKKDYVLEIVGAGAPCLKI